MRTNLIDSVSKAEKLAQHLFSKMTHCTMTFGIMPCSRMIFNIMPHSIIEMSGMTFSSTTNSIMT